MIENKKTVSIPDWFKLWLPAGILTAVISGAYTWDHVHSMQSEVVYFIQGCIFIAAADFALLKAGIKVSPASPAADLAGDIKLALKYFLVCLLGVSSVLLLIALVCVILVKSGFITLDVFYRYMSITANGAAEKDYFSSVIANSSFKYALYYFSAYILIPLEEEIFFRRLLYVALRKKMRFLPALLISSAFFGLVHGATGGFALLAGLFLGWVYEKKQKLAANVIIHGLLNFSIDIVRLVL